MSDWKGFTSEVESLSANHKRRGCGMNKLLASLELDARRHVEEALARDDITSTGLEAALRNRLGERVPSSFTIQRHRRGSCYCATTKGDKK